MTVLYQIPRNSLIWLLLAQTALIAPHVPRLPILLLLCWIGTGWWRIQVYRGRWAYPGPWLRLLLVAICVGGLVAQYGRLFGLEPMVGLLITAFLLKLLEMHRKRDALIVIFLGYFVAATEFLFTQTIAMSLYMTAAVILLTTALIGIYQQEGHRHPGRSLLLATRLIGQSLPVMLVLFLLMPRLGALWAVPQQSQSARTGVSDSMSPGDFSSLARSEGVAFRVTFDGDIPPGRQLYWRGLVFSDFDGRRWQQSRFSDYRRGTPVAWGGESGWPWLERVDERGSRVDYEIILEPTQQLWLYALPVPVAAERSIGHVADLRLINRRPVTNRMRYGVTSYLTFRADAQGLSSWERARDLRLPNDFNLRSLETAKTWYAEATNAEAYIARVLAYFNAEFSYTLQPPLLGRDSVDEFLWQTKRGFCEHFASSFVVLMRAAGIPARVVVGYQGGTINPLEGYLVVRQSDAHAWAEVWLENRGWLRVDPTAAVAPDRIELGLSSALTEEDASLLDDAFNVSAGGFAGWINRLRLRLDVWEYNWHRWVMGYDQSTQASVLERLLGRVSPARVAVFLLVAGCIVLGAVGAGLAWTGRSPRLDPADRLYQQFLRRLNRWGIQRMTHEGPRSFAARVERARPEIKSWINDVTQAYEQYMYRGDRAAFDRLKHAVRRARISAR